MESRASQLVAPRRSSSCVGIWSHGMLPAQPQPAGPPRAAGPRPLLHEGVVEVIEVWADEPSDEEPDHPRTTETDGVLPVAVEERPDRDRSLRARNGTRGRRAGDGTPGERRTSPRAHGPQLRSDRHEGEHIAPIAHRVHDDTRHRSERHGLMGSISRRCRNTGTRSSRGARSRRSGRGGWPPPRRAAGEVDGLAAQLTCPRATIASISWRPMPSPLRSTRRSRPRSTPAAASGWGTRRAWTPRRSRRRRHGRGTG